MDIINEYQTRVRQASTTEEKKAIAAELHQLATTFSIEQRKEYEEAMQQQLNDVVVKMSMIDPVIQRAQNLVVAIEARRLVQV